MRYSEKFHVEHWISKVLRLLICLFIATGLSACRSEDPTPEIRDPIYQALVKELADAEKALEEVKRAKEVATKKVEAAPAQTMDLKDAEKEYWKAEKQLDGLITAVAYLKIRTERRKIESRLIYRAAFKAGKEAEWPDPAEYQGYLTNKRLREASLNWSRRVPKLQDRILASETPKVEPAKEGRKE